jgi:hypothetical protein
MGLSWHPQASDLRSPPRAKYKRIRKLIVPSELGYSGLIDILDLAFLVQLCVRVGCAKSKIIANLLIEAYDKGIHFSAKTVRGLHGIH